MDHPEIMYEIQMGIRDDQVKAAQARKRVKEQAQKSHESRELPVNISAKAAVAA